MNHFDNFGTNVRLLGK